MSGSSLDGLDIAYAEFWKENNKWNYHLLKGETVEYSTEWQNILKEIRTCSATELLELHHQYGKLLGTVSDSFIKKHDLKPDLIASHGHTVFHKPHKGYTFQLGCGQEIATKTNLLTIADFRSKDISLGGQGAPLVPIGDELLFSDYVACINIGGIANISYKQDGNRVGFDTGPANQLLNFLANEKGLDFDKDGALAIKGSIIEKLLQQLSDNDYYSKPVPKSLSNEYVSKNFIPLLMNSTGSTENKLCTVTNHIADEIMKALSLIDSDKNKKVLVTGGGAKNKFLISRLSEISPYQIIIPDQMLLDYKEALIFAFMGVLKSKNEINCLASVTGANQNSSSGIIFLP